MDSADDPKTVQGALFSALGRLEGIRRAEDVFDADAEVTIVDYSDPAILWIRRRAGEKSLDAVFNFSDEARTAWMPVRASYEDLVTGAVAEFQTFELDAWDFRWYLSA